MWFPLGNVWVKLIVSADIIVYVYPLGEVVMKRIVDYIVFAVFVLLEPGMSLVAQDRDSLVVRMDSVRLADGMADPVFPVMHYSEEEIDDYFHRRWDCVVKSSASPVVSLNMDTSVPYTVLYSFGGLWGGIYGTMPVAGRLHSFMGAGSFDVFNVYNYSSVYVGAGVELAPWLELNGGGIYGVNMFRDMKPLPEFGGRLGLVLRPSDRASMMLWGEYVDVGGTISAPTFNPVSVPVISVGASAKFKVGDATIGIGASVTTH